ncbi:unnamed protein product, partial [Polarella glacialis]
MSEGSRLEGPLGLSRQRSSSSLGSPTHASLSAGAPVLTEGPTAWAGHTPVPPPPSRGGGGGPGQSAAASIQQLVDVTQKQEAKLQELRRDFQVLIECLDESGVICRESYEVRLHRARFQRVLRAHPFQCTASLRDVLMTRELALACARHTGSTTFGILSTTSHLISQVATEVMPSVDKMFPHSIYSCGGVGGADGHSLSTAERYNPLTDVWQGLPPMSERRWGMSSAVVAGKLYVCGGSGGGNNRLSTAECFDPCQEVWEPVPSMSEARWSAAVAVMFRRLYVCGGLGAGAQPLHTAECFDPVSGQWWPLPPMACGRCSSVCAALWGQLYVCGGSGDGARRLGSTERLDPLSGVWSAGPSLAEPRSNAAGVVVSGMLYLCGGLGEGAQRLSSVERLVPNRRRRGRESAARDVWDLVPPMIEQRSTAAACALGGKLYICGGLGDAGTALCSVERFDPEAGTWESIPPMRGRRWE